MLAPFGEVGGHDLERDLSILDMPCDSVGKDEAGELLPVDQERGEALSLQEIPEARPFDAEQVFGRLHPVGEDKAGIIADVLGREAGGIGSSDHRAEAAAGDDRRLDPHFIEDFEHGDMGEAARRAAAEGKADLRRAHAPASLAKCQAVSAKGRTSPAMRRALRLAAVPSRTRPTMPCRMAAIRKKLYAR